MSITRECRRIGLATILASAALGLHSPERISGAPGDLYASDSAAGKIVRYAGDGTATTFVDGLSEPEGLAFDRSGNLFVVENGTGSILKFTPAGDKTVLATGLFNPAALAFDASGKLYATNLCPFDMGCGDIFEYDSEGIQSVFFHGLNFGSLALDESGNLFAGEAGTVQTGMVDRFTSGGMKSTFTMNAGAPAALVFDTMANLFVADPLSGRIYKFSPAGAQTVFTEDVDGPIAMAFDASGVLFIGNSGNDTITKFSTAGSKTTFATGVHPAGLAFEPVLATLRNMSARAAVGTGDNVLINGFILGGNALATNAIVVRAIGPSLANSGVSDSLQDPILELHDGNGVLIATNDNWQDSQKDQLVALGLAPTDPKESALYATLAAGSYTAVVRGGGDTTGVALVEIYGIN
jgi:sugar lactone lactonase YvrE